MRESDRDSAAAHGQQVALQEAEELRRRIKNDDGRRFELQAVIDALAVPDATN